MRHFNPRHQRLANALSDTQAISGHATNLALKYNPTIRKGKVQSSLGAVPSRGSVTPSTGSGHGATSADEVSHLLINSGLVSAPHHVVGPVLASLYPKLKTGAIKGSGIAAAIKSPEAGILGACMQRLKNASAADAHQIRNAERTLKTLLKSLKLLSKRKAILEKQMVAFQQLKAQDSINATGQALTQLSAEIAHQKGVLVTKIAGIISQISDQGLIDCLLKVAEAEGALEAHAEHDEVTVDEAMYSENGEEVLVQEAEAGALIEEAAATVTGDEQIVPTGLQPRTSLIKGIPNMYLGIGALALLGVLALRR